MSTRESKTPGGQDWKGTLADDFEQFRQESAAPAPSVLERLAGLARPAVQAGRIAGGLARQAAAGATRVVGEWGEGVVKTAAESPAVRPYTEAARRLNAEVEERTGVDVLGMPARNVERTADAIGGGAPDNQGEAVAHGLGATAAGLATFVVPGSLASKAGILPRIVQGGMKGYAGRTGVNVVAALPGTAAYSQDRETSTTAFLADLTGSETLDRVASTRTGRMVGDLALDVLMSGAVEAGLAGLRSATRAGRRGAKVGEGGESIPDTPDAPAALPPGRYEMPPAGAHASPEDFTPAGHRLLAPGPRVFEAGPVREAGYPRRAADGSLGVNPLPAGRADPVYDAVLEPDPITSRLAIPARTAGPIITPAPAGSVLDPNRVDRLAAGAVNQVRRSPPAGRAVSPATGSATYKTPPPSNAEAVAPVSVRELAEDPISARLAGGPAQPPAAAAGLDPAGSRLAAPSLRGLSRQGRDLLVALEGATSREEAFAAAADLIRLPDGDRRVLAPLVQQVVDALPDAPIRPRPEPPARPSEPVPAPAPAAGGRAVPAAARAVEERPGIVATPEQMPEGTPGMAPAPGVRPEAGPEASAPVAPWDRRTESVAAAAARGHPEAVAELPGAYAGAVRSTHSLPHLDELRGRVAGDPALSPVQRDELAAQIEARAGELRAPRGDALPEAPPAAPERPRYTPGERVAGADGREGTALFADNSSVPVRYRVVEAESLQPSHDPFSFQPNPRYPEGVQGRGYHRDAGARALVEQATQGFRPSRLLDPTDLVNEGPPLITPDGIAVAGNQRSMLVRRLGQLRPEKADEYRAALAERATHYGLDPESFQGMRAPVLVREIVGEGLDLADPNTLRELNTRSDMEVGKVKDALSDAETRARQMQRADRALAHLAGSIGEDQTLTAYLGTSDGLKFVRLLQEDGAIAAGEVSQFLDPRGVTLGGRQRIQAALLTAAVGDADTVLRAPDGVLSKLEHAVPSIITAARTEGFNVSVALREALDTLAEMRSRGASSVDELVRMDAQQAFFDAPPERNPLVLQLARFLDSGRKRDVTEAFRGFATDARDAGTGHASDLFGGRPRTFREAFAERFPAGEAGAWRPAHALADPLVAGALGMVPGSAAGANLDDKDPRRGAMLGALAGFAAGVGGGVGLLRAFGSSPEEVVRSIRQADVQTSKGGAYKLQRETVGSAPGTVRYEIQTPRGPTVVEVASNGTALELRALEAPPIGEEGRRAVLAQVLRRHPGAERIVEGPGLAQSAEAGAWRFGGQGFHATREAAQEAQERHVGALLGKGRNLLSMPRTLQRIHWEAGRAFSRGVNWMESLGPHGKLLAADVRAIDERAARRLATDATDARKILDGLTPDERRTVARVLNRRPVPELENKIPRRLFEKAEQLRGVLDRSMHDFAAAGGRRYTLDGRAMEIKGSGKAFPQVPNKEGVKFLEAAAQHGLGSPRVAALAELMVKRGEAIDAEDALNRILSYRSGQLRGVHGYLERTRFTLPDDLVEWDPAAVLPGLMERNALVVEGVKQWGVGFQRAHELIGRIGAESDEAYKATLARFIGHHFGAARETPGLVHQVVGAVSNYETIVRLGLSVLSTVRQIGQRFTNTATMPLSAQLQALRDYPPFLHRWIGSARKLEEEIARSGAVRYRTALGNTEGAGLSSRVTDASLKYSGFAGAEIGNQTHSALVARYALEHDLSELARLQGERGPMRRLLDSLASLSTDPAGAASRRLHKLGLSDEQVAEIITSGRRPSPEEFAGAMYRLVQDTQFPITIATERIWWSTSPVLRLAAKFKHFGFEQMRLIYDDVLMEAKRGNVAPLAKFAAATFLMGEVYNIARDTLTGREESFTVSRARGAPEESGVDVAARVLANMADGGGLGILADLTYGLDNFITGPVGSTVANARRAVSDATARPGQVGRSVREFLERESSAWRQLEPMAKRAGEKLGQDHRRFFEYKQARDLAFQHKERQEHPTLGDRAVASAGKAWKGRTEYPTNERSQTYRFARDAITANDVQGAAEYLAALLADAEDLEERDTMLQGMRSSMKSQAPLGPLSEEERAAFLRTLPPPRRRAFLRLQAEWVRDYEKAISQAEALAYREQRRRREAAR